MTDVIKNDPGGFTLIEAMVVVALIAIISAVAIPAWQSMMRNSDLKSAAYEVMTVIQWAKSEATKRNICVGIQFNPPAPTPCPTGQGDCYEIFRDDDTNGGVACDSTLNNAERALIGTPDNKILRSGSLGTKAKVNTTFQNNAIAISPRGILRTGGLPNGHVGLRAVNGTNNCYKLTISPTAGLRLDPSQWKGSDCP